MSPETRADPKPRFLYVPKEGPPQPDLQREEWTAALADGEGVVWLDITDGGQEANAILSGLFTFHPLAIADALQQQHVPRVDEWDDYVYCVIGELSLDVGGEISVRHDELDMFLGPNYPDPARPVPRWTIVWSPPAGTGDGAARRILCMSHDQRHERLYDDYG